MRTDPPQSAIAKQHIPIAAAVASQRSASQTTNSSSSPVVHVSRPPKLASPHGASTTVVTDSAKKLIREDPPAAVPKPHFETPEDQSVKALWLRAIDQMEDMTGDFAREAVEVAQPELGKLRVTFASHQLLNRTQLEKPDRKAKLEQAMSKSFGRRMQVEFVSLAASPENNQPHVPTGVSRVQRMRALEQDPFVRRMKAIFEVEIIKIDEPRRPL